MTDGSRPESEKPCSVVQVTDSVSALGGGLAEIVHGLNQALSDAGRLESRVLAARDAATERAHGRWEGVEVELVPSWRLGPWQSASGLKAALLGEKSSVWHLHGIWGCAARSVASAMKGRARSDTRLVVSPQGMLEPWALERSRLKKALSWKVWERCVFEEAACLHALSLSEAEQLRARGLKGPIAVIPNGVTQASVEAEGEKSSMILNDMSGRERRELLFLGRLHPKKGLRELIAAWARLSPTRRKGWVLTVAGWDDGGFRSEYEAQAEALGLRGEICFEGEVAAEDRSRRLAGASAFVLPSFSEGMPMAVLEAWAAGLPVLLTPGCHLQEGQAAGAAIEVEPDEAALADGLERLLALNAEELQKMGGRGKALVLERFTWERVAERWTDVYAWLAGGPRPSGEWLLPESR